MDNLNHILVVDDDDRIRSLLKEYLNDNKFLVSTAQNSEEAKIRLSHFKFDLIILDVMMPGQSGYELIKEIKNDDCPPIILLTAKGEVQSRIKGLELGADDYIGKPFEPKELLLRINNIISKKIKIEMLLNPGKTYSRSRIGELSGILQERSIDVMITRLRQKIEVDPKNPKYLQTIRGSGYVLWIE